MVPPAPRHRCTQGRHAPPAKRPAISYRSRATNQVQETRHAAYD